ncbi:hypothetical protein [Actinomadura sp. 21ATH]|uniref:hypothetical protein n=1 Tax=Actinomadura sp. 21ATH TaxID=1735444 RepID=UPI0035BF2B3F
MLAARNIALIAAHEQACASGEYDDPAYRYWHDHLTGLIGELRPGAAAAFLAHVLLGAFGGDLARRITADGGDARLRGAVHELAAALVPGLECSR